MPQEDRLVLKKMTFTKSLRGYSCDEVDVYLEYVTDKYNQICREYTEIRRKLTALAARESELREDDEQKMKDRLTKCQATCDAMVDEAKRQAARILADAENEAELLVRQAEEEAQSVAARAAKEGTRAQHEASRSVAAKSNLADRLVQEIDSFRSEVFAMYAEHIDTLERLGKLTDEFYRKKNDMTEGEEPIPETPAIAEVPETHPEDAYLPETVLPTSEAAQRVYAQANIGSVGEEDTAEGIDWQARTAAVLMEEQESSADTWSEPDSISDEGTWDEPETDSSEENLIHSVSADILRTDSDGEDAAESITESDDMRDTEELLRTLFGDTGWEEAAEEDVHNISETDSAIEELPEYIESPEDADSEEAPLSDENDILLADLKAVYGMSANVQEEEPETDTAEAAEIQETRTVSPRSAKPKAARHPQDIDDLFMSGDATNSIKDMSLTGEFDLIFSNDKSMRNVEEIGKQPLVTPEAPKKPKKHSKF